MKSLGIELKGSTCIGVILDSSLNLVSTLKIELNDSYNSSAVNDFAEQFKAFLSSHNPDVIVVKKRQEKGKFAGGAISFKMEGLIQFLGKETTTFISAAQLSAFQKKPHGDLPDVKKYQSQALFCALYALNI